MRFFRFLRKKGVVEAKPEAKIVEQKFPRISSTEQKKYVGKHVAIVDGKIVAFAGTAKRVLTTAKRRYPGKEIILRYVGSERLLIKCKCIEDQ
jgi:hypothetical protein